MLEHHEAPDVVQQSDEVGFGRIDAEARRQFRRLCGGNGTVDGVLPKTHLVGLGRHKDPLHGERSNMASYDLCAQARHGVTD